MPTVTALRADRRGRVAVELDGRPWRALPADVVVRAGLAEGRPLDRPALRLVRRELRRAEALAARGYGDEAIRHRLQAEGLPEEAVGELEPETERARPLIERRGPGPRTARYLASRGFGEEALEAALGEAFGQEG